MYIKSLLSFLFVLVFVSSNAQTVENNFIENEIYVKIKDEVNIGFQAKQRDLELPQLPFLSAEIIKEYKVSKAQSTFNFSSSPKLIRIFRITAYGDLEKLIEKLEENNTIEYAEKIPVNKVDYIPNDMGVNSTSGNGQWFLHTINAIQAWDYSKGDSIITVAVIDAEVEITHPDLKNNIWVNPGEIPNNGIDDDNNGYIDDMNGWDAGDNDNDPIHPNKNFSHGTHVAGCASASTDNGIGVAGIGYNVSIMAVKCTRNSSNNFLSISHGYEGISYAAEAGADIINCSWSSNFPSNTGAIVVDDAINKGSIVVAAASNDGVNVKVYPGGFSGVICVASSDISDDRSSFSNYGTWVTITAPGSDIRSTYVNSSYIIQSGTSMATPITCGLLGLMKSYNQNISNADLLGCLTRNADKTILGLSSQNATTLGAGRIDAHKAMLCIDSTRNSKPISRMNVSNGNICPGGFTDFYGKSVGGYEQHYQWIFNGGIVDNDTIKNPRVTYNDTGSYDATLIISNHLGTDTITYENIVRVDANGTQVVYEQKFETGDLTSLGFTQEKGSANTWQTASIISPGGTKAAYINLFDSTGKGSITSLITPDINLSGMANAVLSFEYAYTTSNNANKDTLFIDMSIDGGASYPYRLAVLNEQPGHVFKTVGNSTVSYFPSSLSDWCSFTNTGAVCAPLNLLEADFKDQVKIKFSMADGNGNNFFIDNIVVSANCASINTKKPVAKIEVTNESECLPYTTTLKDISDNFPVTRKWTIHGLTPDSVFTNKQIKADIALLQDYDVTLWVENENGADSITMPKLIKPKSSPDVSLVYDNTTICPDQAVNITASGANTYSWSPVYAISSSTNPSVSVTPAFSISYIVTGTALNGCKDTASVFIKVLPRPSKPNVRIENGKLVTDSSGNIFHWYLGTDSINNSNSNTIMPTVSGNYRVEVFGENGCKNASNYIFYSPASVDNVLKGNGIWLQHASTENIAFIHNDNGFGLQYSLYDITGKELLSGSSSAQNIPINTDEYAQGIYMLNICNNGLCESYKLLK